MNKNEQDVMIKSCPLLDLCLDLSREACFTVLGSPTPLGHIEHNAPHLSSARTTLSAVLDDLGEAGIAPEQHLLMGFSQGACLVLEFTARHARRFAVPVGNNRDLTFSPG